MSDHKERMKDLSRDYSFPDAHIEHEKGRLKSFLGTAAANFRKRRKHNGSDFVRFYKV